MIKLTYKKSGQHFLYCSNLETNSFEEVKVNQTEPIPTSSEPEKTNQSD